MPRALPYPGVEPGKQEEIPQAQNAVAMAGSEDGLAGVFVLLGMLVVLAAGGYPLML